MAVASKLLAILAASPFPVLAAHRPHLLRLASSSFRRYGRRRRIPLLLSPPHTHSMHSPLYTNALQHSVPLAASDSVAPGLLTSGPMEWDRLVDLVTSASGGSRFSVIEGDYGSADFLDAVSLGEEFLRVARACLQFAEERPELIRSMSKKDLDVLLGQRVTYLFKDEEVTRKKLQSYLSEGNVYETEKVETVDVMRYLLSYMYNHHKSINLSKGTFDSSVRSLLSTLVSTGMHQTYSIPEPSPNEISTAQDLPFKGLPGQNIEMKRGDWICPKCSFLNFARNSTCLECDETRPQRTLTGGEWECPQCTFFNYGRNMACLRCDCRRPSEIPLNLPSLLQGFVNSPNASVEGILSRSTTDRTDTARKLAENDEKAGRWLSKVSQLGDSADIDSLAADDDFPDIMPMRKGVNRFVVSTRKSPSERRLADEQFNSGAHGVSSGGLTDQKQHRDFAPFVPLPPDMFAKNQKTGANVDDSSAAPSVANSTERFYSNSSSDDAERWSRKVDEIDDVTNLSSVISDGELPEIMPMRKGENDFIVSKRKDRSATSPQFKRRVALEQESNSTFVPFVPFPPNYFARTTETQAGGPSSSSVQGSSQSPVSCGNEAAMRKESTSDLHGVGNQQNNFRNPITGPRDGSLHGGSYDNSAQTRQKIGYDRHSRSSGGRDTSHVSTPSYNTGSIVTDPRHSGSNYGNSFGSADPERTSTDSRINNSWNNSPAVNYSGQSVRGSGGSVGSNNCSSQPTSGASFFDNTRQPEAPLKTSESWNASSPRKSLEGSAVKEPDPLDMSEEAKAERWFRRAAQIKNISELADIPDEDFPQIMPMRKGVNRFVVSKRKTPLERRLTSPEYRRNLPVVRSEPREDDAS